MPTDERAERGHGEITDEASAVDETAGKIHETEAANGTQVVDRGESRDVGERTGPDVMVYSASSSISPATES